jgi:hypothetical protein
VTENEGYLDMSVFPDVDPDAVAGPDEIGGLRAALSSGAPDEEVVPVDEFQAKPVDPTTFVAKVGKLLSVRQ